MLQLPQSLEDPPTETPALVRKRDFPAPRVSGGDPASPKRKRRPKLSSRFNIWLRRIHLFSGLFMLPWVLLYGFTALLFNHPTYMTDSRTEVKPIELADPLVTRLPRAAALAKLAVASANSKLDSPENDRRPTIQLISPDNAVFTRQAVGTLDTDDQNLSLVLDLNTGSGYMKVRTKADNLDSTKSSDQNDQKTSLADGMNLSLDFDATEEFRTVIEPQIRTVIADPDLSDFRLRSLPTIEFDALIDGQRRRLRLASQQNRRGQRGLADTKQTTKESYRGQLSLIGENQREVSARSFLLRLHKAHGYPIQTNVRWFWAIAVDLMFASMCFWGLSGVVMWWQIKRTRRLGFLCLVASAVIATWLAIGMHWHIVNG